MTVGLSFLHSLMEWRRGGDFLKQEGKPGLSNLELRT